MVVFADFPVGRAAAGVEIPQAGAAQAPGMAAIGKNPFHHQLAAAIGIDGILRVGFADRQFFRHAIGRAGGGENEHRAVEFLHHLEQLDRFRRVVLIVFQRIGDRFPDVSKRGKMNHRAEPMCFEQRAHQLLIAHVADDQLHPRIDDGLIVTEHQIVQHHDFPALIREQPDGMGADVTGSSCDENGRVGDRHEILGAMKPENDGCCQLMLLGYYPIG